MKVNNEGFAEGYSAGYDGLSKDFVFWIKDENKKNWLRGYKEGKEHRFRRLYRFRRL